MKIQRKAFWRCVYILIILLSLVSCDNENGELEDATQLESVETNIADQEIDALEDHNEDSDVTDKIDEIVDKVHFQDEEFEKQVLINIGIDKENLSYSVLEAQEELRFENCEINSFEDLKMFPNLRILSFHGGVKLNCRLSELTKHETIEELYFIGETSKILHIEDNLSFINELPKLQVLYIDHAEIGGTVEDIVGASNLRKLVLHCNGISGELSELSNLRNLEHLRITATSIKGSTNNFNDFERLNYLSLSYCEPTVNLCDLSNLNDLQYLYLKQIQLNGSVADLSKLHHLKELSILDLYDISSFSDIQMEMLTHFKEIEVIDFGGASRVVGNIESLQELDALRQIKIYSHKLEGDIASLSEMYNLEEISLRFAEVHGNISGFNQLSDLKILDLTGTEVSGDANDLKPLINLESIYLSLTNVSGDINFVESMFELENIDVSDTAISGELKVFSELKHIKRIYIGSTKIIGDLSCLNNLSALKYIGIKDTELTGKLTPSGRRKVIIE